MKLCVIGSVKEMTVCTSPAWKLYRFLLHIIQCVALVCKMIFYAMLHFLCMLSMNKFSLFIMRRQNVFITQWIHHTYHMYVTYVCNICIIYMFTVCMWPVQYRKSLFHSKMNMIYSINVQNLFKVQFFFQIMCTWVTLL